MKRYLFIDRDGTLIEEPADQQIDSIEKFALLPDTISALQRLSQSGYRFVMVSNQDGLGTTSYPKEKFEMIQNLLLNILSSQGIHFEETLLCPHFSHEGCACRKPLTHLVQHYLRSNEMDRAASYVIGDRATDLQLAQNMGLQGLQISKSNSWSDIAHLILAQPRIATLKRKTKETAIEVQVDLDRVEPVDIRTGVGFFDHMLEQLARHGGFSLKVTAEGDLHIDEHHLVEDVAITLGNALKQALGDKRGVGRYGFWLPMDEANARATLDLSGRTHFHLRGRFPSQNVGGLSTEMIPHFFRSLADGIAMSLQIEAEGENTHHIVESIFKAVGRSFRMAFAKGTDFSIPSTKGTL